MMRTMRKQAGMYGENPDNSTPGVSYSGGEVRMSQSRVKPWEGFHQGTPVGYRMIVSKTDDHRFGAECSAKEMEPLLTLLRQFEGIGYHFVRLERVYGG